MFIEGNVRDPKRVKKRRIAHDLVCPRRRPSPWPQQLRTCWPTPTSMASREKVAELIRLAWLGRHVPQPDDLESFLFPDRLSRRRVPRWCGSSMATAFTAEEAHGFGGGRVIRRLGDGTTACR